MFRWFSLVFVLVALNHLLLSCNGNPNPKPLVRSAIKEKPVFDKQGAADDRATIEKTAGGGGGGGNTGNGDDGGGGGDDDDDESDYLKANRAEVKGLLAHLLDGSNEAYHYFIIDEYDDYNPNTVGFKDWRTRQSICVESPVRTRENRGKKGNQLIPCFAPVEFFTIGGTPGLEDLEELDSRMSEIKDYSANEHLELIEYTMFLEYTSYTSGKDFSFRIISGNGVTSNEMHASQDEFYCEDVLSPFRQDCVWSPEDGSKRNITPYEWIKGRLWHS